MGVPSLLWNLFMLQSPSTHTSDLCGGKQEESATESHQLPRDILQKCFHPLSITQPPSLPLSINQPNENKKPPNPKDSPFPQPRKRTPHIALGQKTRDPPPTGLPIILGPVAGAEGVPDDVLARARGDEFGGVGEAADDGHAGEAGGGGGCEGSAEEGEGGGEGGAEGG